MNRHAAYAYAQARLQARHAARPDAATWRRLDTIRDPAHLLQTARTTGLRPWVLHLSADTPIHEQELYLHQQWRDYVDAVAGWHPAAWRPALRWCLWLPELPAAAHLLAGRPAPSWMRDDPWLRPLTLETPAARAAALEASPLAPLLTARRRSVADVAAAWHQHWLTLAPETPTALWRPIATLAAHIADYHATLRAPGLDESAAARRDLEEKITTHFRRHGQQPAAALAHLALVAIDLQRLRGALARRRLLPRVASDVA